MEQPVVREILFSSLKNYLLVLLHISPSHHMIEKLVTDTSEFGFFLLLLDLPVLKF